MEGDQMEENLYIIQDLYKLISPHMPCDQSKILAVNYSRLKSADHYGSTLLRLTIELVNTTTGEDWTLAALAKTLPKYTIRHDLGYVQAIFKNEVGIYTVARRAINEFLKEKGVENGEEFFLSTFGGRLNLNGTNQLDHNAALIIMDFKVLGYKTVHRRTGFDLETTKAILTSLAKFHASTLAFKLTRPKEFKDRVRPFLGKCYTTAGYEDIARSHLIAVLKREGFASEVIERTVKVFDRKCSREVREPWATFAHNNFWVRNILVKFDLRNKHPIDVKFKGFQECEYNSPLRDVLFFLCTSVQLVTLRQHLDELIEFYYQHFIVLIRSFGVDTKPFSRQHFNQELKAAASKGEFYKTVCMLYPILGAFIEDEYVSHLKDPLHINRLCFIVREFDKRDWLYL